jgi:hypothetical protein
MLVLKTELEVSKQGHSEGGMLLARLTHPLGKLEKNGPSASRLLPVIQPPPSYISTHPQRRDPGEAASRELAHPGAPTCYLQRQGPLKSPLLWPRLLMGNLFRSCCYHPGQVPGAGQRLLLPQPWRRRKERPGQTLTPALLSEAPPNMEELGKAEKKLNP